MRPARRACARPPCLARMLHIGREQLAERGGILGVQIDLIAGVIHGEPAAAGLLAPVAPIGVPLCRMGFPRPGVGVVVG
jgi:hypothetical protein